MHVAHDIVSLPSKSTRSTVYIRFQHLSVDQCPFSFGNFHFEFGPKPFSNGILFIIIYFNCKLFLPGGSGTATNTTNNT
jgi:hypothetical protein